MAILMRALTWATLFVGVVLVFVPAQIVSSPGLEAVDGLHARQLVGIAIGAAGAALAAWCILAFAIVGRGTPAPFDPPRRLVVRGPYRYVRNPMYLGAGLALAGAALLYRSGPLLAYVALFLVVAHLFVVLYEEPTLTRTFGDAYRDYCARVRRWRPTRPRSDSES